MATRKMAPDRSAAKVVALRPRLDAPDASGGADEGPAERPAPRVIAVTSGKGGVGKTSVSVNLAVALARRGKRVLLVDADLGLANVDTMLGLHPRGTLRDVVAGASTLDDVLLHGPDGVAIAPAASGFDEMARLGAAPLEGLIARIAELARGFDVALVDTAAGISPEVLAFVLAADERLLVATPEPTSLTDAYAMIKVCATRYGQRSFGLVINMARTRHDARAASELLSRVSAHFLGLTPIDRGFLPWDPELLEAVRRQRSVLDLAPRSAISLAVQGLAAEVCRGADGGERPATLFRAPLEEVRG